MKTKTPAATLVAPQAKLSGGFYLLPLTQVQEKGQGDRHTEDHECGNRHPPKLTEGSPFEDQEGHHDGCGYKYISGEKLAHRIGMELSKKSGKSKPCSVNHGRKWV